MDRLLEGKVAVVTGGGRGIGREVALAMAQHGASVVVNDVGAALSGAPEDARPADEVVAEIRAAGGEAVASTDSVAAWASAQAIVQTAVDSFGRVDILVNNAGILRDNIFHKMQPEEFEAVIQVHLLGGFYMSRAAAEHFRRQEGGSYVHMTSTAGLIGNVGQANYMAAKMGIVGLSRGLAQDLQRFNIRSNCIAPFADTRMTRSVVVAPALREAREKRISAWRPQGIASLAVALCSEACKDISGQIFGARGGEVFVFNQPRPVRSVHKDGGWSAEGLAKVLPKFQSVYSPVSEIVMTWDSIET